MTNRCLDWRVGLLGHNSHWESNNFCQQTLPLLPVAEVQISDAKHGQGHTKTKWYFLLYFSAFCVYLHPPAALSPKAGLSSRCEDLLPLGKQMIQGLLYKLWLWRCMQGILPLHRLQKKDDPPLSQQAALKLKLQSQCPCFTAVSNINPSTAAVPTWLSPAFKNL